MTRQLSHIFFAEALTFMLVSCPVLGRDIVGAKHTGPLPGTRVIDIYFGRPSETRVLGAEARRLADIDDVVFSQQITALASRRRKCRTRRLLTPSVVSADHEGLLRGCSVRCVALSR